MLWDALASGRIARGERWAFAGLDNEIRMITTSGKSMVERYRVTPTGEWAEMSAVHDWDYVGTFYVMGEAVDEERWKRLEERIEEILNGCRDRVLAGVSEPSVQGRVVRLLTRSAPDLISTLQSIWRTARAQLLGLPVPALRKY